MFRQRAGEREDHRIERSQHRLPAHGRCVTAKGELRALARRGGTFTCYVVEVCPACGWNHLARTWALGRGDRSQSTGS